MNFRVWRMVLQAVVLAGCLSFGANGVWAQTFAAESRQVTNGVGTAEWKTIKHGKHVTIRVRPDASVAKFRRVTLGTVNYSGPAKKLKDEERDKLVSLLRESLARDLSSTQAGGASSATQALVLHADITDVKKVHPWVNVVTIAAVFVPLDFGGATVKARMVDEQTGEEVAEIETQGCGQVYEVLASLRSLGQSKLALKKDSRVIAKEVARMSEEQSAGVEAGSEGTEEKVGWSRRSE